MERSGGETRYARGFAISVVPRRLAVDGGLARSCRLPLRETSPNHPIPSPKPLQHPSICTRQLCVKREEFDVKGHRSVMYSSYDIGWFGLSHCRRLCCLTHLLRESSVVGYLGTHGFRRIGEGKHRSPQRYGSKRVDLARISCLPYKLGIE